MLPSITDPTEPQLQNLTSSCGLRKELSKQEITLRISNTSRIHRLCAPLQSTKDQDHPVTHSLSWNNVRNSARMQTCVTHTVVLSSRVSLLPHKFDWTIHPESITRMTWSSTHSRQRAGAPYRIGGLNLTHFFRLNEHEGKVQPIATTEIADISRHFFGLLSSFSGGGCHD